MVRCSPPASISAVAPPPTPVSCPSKAASSPARSSGVTPQPLAEAIPGATVLIRANEPRPRAPVVSRLVVRFMTTPDVSGRAGADQARPPSSWTDPDRRPRGPTPPVSDLGRPPAQGAAPRVVTHGERFQDPPQSPSPQVRGLTEPADEKCRSAEHTSE